MANILICTGIYPPAIGGPSQYAKEVAEEFRKQNHVVNVLTYGKLIKFPTIIRHEIFFWRTLFKLRKVDFILALDTFSVAWPATVAAKLLNKKIIIRTGGDFLWESYVERTGDLVLFKDFYSNKREFFSIKEKLIFKLTKWTIQNAGAVVFSTKWQKEIFERAYDLDTKKNFIVENFYGQRLFPVVKSNRTYVAGTRLLKWKNIELLKKAFEEAKKSDPTIVLDTDQAPYEVFLEKIRASYAVILISLGDISPNMILDAVRTSTPFILTKETGLYERLKDIGLFVNPNDINDIEEKILFLADKVNYDACKTKIESFNFTHSWAEISNELIEISRKI